MSGLHNRHMVGLTAWQTFFQTTHLTLHEKKVLVIGLWPGRPGRCGCGKSLWWPGNGCGTRACSPSAGRI